MLKSLIARLGRLTGNTKVRYTLAAIGFVLVGAVAGLVQGAFAQSSPTKNTATRSSAPAAPEHINVNPMGTAANAPDSLTSQETNNTTANQNTAPTNNSIDFSFNPPSTVNLSDGDQPSVAASTLNGQAVNWIVTGDSYGYLKITPQTNTSVKTARFLFTVSKAISNVPAGNYSITVTASLAGTQSITHHITVSVPETTPFTLSALSQDHSSDGSTTTIYLPFEIIPTSGTQLSSVTVSPPSASSNPVNSTIQVLEVKNNGTAPDGSLQKAVEVQVPASYTGTIDVPVTVSESDGSYSKTLPLSYTIKSTTNTP